MKKSSLGILLKIFAIIVLLCSIAYLVFEFDIDPVIELEKEDLITLEVFDEYNDDDVTAYLQDKVFAFTSPLQLVIDSNINTTKIGEYKVTYNCELLWKKISKERTIIVKDTTAPVIELVELTELVDPIDGTYEEPGFKAIDNYDGDITDQVLVERENDLITYSVQDSSGNSYSIQREIKYGERKKVIYLTFDDGPSRYTSQLLDVLDKYNVKATFFTVGAYGYHSMIAEEAKRGHAIGIHTYSHNYSKIYTSVEAFMAEVDKQNQIIYEQTGQYSNLIRFPGGSSNTVSRPYCVGIMSTLADYLMDNGYAYFDWNVESGDAGRTTDTDEVYQYTINGIRSMGNNPSIVLQHDSKGYSVAAVERIIQWGLANGYEFRPLKINSPTAHHGIRN